MGTNMPQFGCLQGVKVLSSGAVLAGPLAPTLFAENGAEVIYTESSVNKDILRMLGSAWIQEHRNNKIIALNIPSPEGREIFLKLIKWCDIWVESSKPGTYDKWGLTDEVLWENNPRLVIVHVSGFGQTGDPSYVPRASYDPVGQSFSGYANLNGSPEMPYLGRPYLNDYFTGFQVAWSALAAYIRALKTGVGESVDVTQYEVMTRIQAGWSIDGLTDGKEFKRFTSSDLNAAGDMFYKCKNDKFIFLAISGAGPMQRGCSLIGLGDDPDFKGVSMVLKIKPYAEKFVQAIRDYCAARTDVEVEQEMAANGIPCSRVYDYADILSDPHFKARENIIECYDPIGERTVKTFAPSPKFKKNPQQVWCAGGKFGCDNEEVLKQFGYSDNQIAELYEKKIIAKE